MEQNTNKTALLVMDLQPNMLGPLAGSDTLITNVAKAIANARQNNMPVIYVVLSFRPGLPEVSRSNKVFAALESMFAKVDMAEFVKMYPEVAPEPGDVIVTKRRYSAFTGSDLEVILRAKGIKHIVFTGVSTSGVVLSTLREAADKDYQLTVLSDCCLDRDEEVHRIMMTKVFPRQADVLTVEEW